MTGFEKTCLTITAIALLALIAVVAAHETAHPPLPEVGSGSNGRTIEPQPKRLATGPINLTVSRKDEARMAELVKRDVTNNGGFVVSHEAAASGHELTLLASEAYMERIARLEHPETRYPEHRELHNWAKTVVRGSDDHEDQDQDTEFTVRIDSPFTDNRWSRYGSIAAMGVATASALALVVPRMAGRSGSGKGRAMTTRASELGGESG